VPLALPSRCAGEGEDARDRNRSSMCLQPVRKAAGLLWQLHVEERPRRCRQHGESFRPERPGMRQDRQPARCAAGSR